MLFETQIVVSCQLYITNIYGKRSFILDENVERRSFSAYKNILADQRESLPLFPSQDYAENTEKINNFNVISSQL